MIQSRELYFASRTWSLAEIASTAVLLRPANISNEHFLENTSDSRSRSLTSPTQSAGWRGRKLSMPASFLSIPSNMACASGEPQYHDQPDVVFSFFFLPV